MTGLPAQPLLNIAGGCATSSAAWQEGLVCTNLKKLVVLILKVVDWGNYQWLETLPRFYGLAIQY